MSFFGKAAPWKARWVVSAAVAAGMAAMALSTVSAVGKQAQQAPAKAPQSKFPEGPGRAILETACGACHGAEVITLYHFATPEEYKDIVNTMIAAGAEVSDKELPVLVDYLFKNWGKKPEGGTVPKTADPGKTILETACTVCHDLSGLPNHIYPNKEGYESLVQGMVSYGAPVTDAQMGPLVDYLFKTYGKKP